MHINSLFVWAKSKQKLSERSRLVRDYVKTHGPCTDWEISNGLGFPHRSAIQPRVSELVKEGLLIEVGTAIDQISGRPCRKVGVSS